jgi:hypothetical protein
LQQVLGEACYGSNLGEVDDSAGGLLGFYGYYHIEGFGVVKIMAKSSE